MSGETELAVAFAFMLGVVAGFIVGFREASLFRREGGRSFTGKAPPPGRIIPPQGGSGTAPPQRSIDTTSPKANIDLNCMHCGVPMLAHRGRYCFTFNYESEPPVDVSSC